MNHKIAIVGMLAASIAAASAANFTTGTVGTINGNNKTILEATGNSLTETVLPQTSQPPSPTTPEVHGILMQASPLLLLERPSP